MCGYPTKSTWLKAVKADNFVGQLLLTGHNVTKYYPETAKTPKGHMNQTGKNERSTEAEQTQLKVSGTTTLRGKKMHNVYTNVYDVGNTIFSNQTG